MPDSHKMGLFNTVIKNLSSLGIERAQDFKILTSTIFEKGFLYSFQALQKLINHGYASNTDVYSIVSRIIETAASVPIEIVEVDSQGEETEVTSGPFYDFVHQPNNRQNRYEFTEEALGYQLLTGNEILSGIIPAGFKMLSQVHVIPSPLVTIKINQETLFDEDVTMVVKKHGKEFPLDPETTKHIKYFNPTEEGLKSGMGLSPAQPSYKTTETSNELATAQSSAMKNRGANGLLSSDGDRGMKKDEKDDLQETINERLGGSHKFNQVVGTSAKVKYTPFGLSPSDLKLIESGVLTLRQLCSAYSADSSNFNDPANKKFSNVKEGDKNFMTKAVLPRLDRHYLGYNELITPGWNEQDNTTYIVRVKRSAIDVLQEDQNKKAEKEAKISKAIGDILMRVGEGKMTPTSAIKLLQFAHNLSETEATEMVADTTNPTTVTNGSETE